MKRSGYMVDSYRLNPKQRMDNMVFQEQVIKIVEDQLLFEKCLIKIIMTIEILTEFLIEQVSDDDAPHRLGVWPRETAVDSGN